MSPAELVVEIKVVGLEELKALIERAERLVADGDDRDWMPELEAAMAKIRLEQVSPEDSR